MALFSILGQSATAAGAPPAMLTPGQFNVSDTGALTYKIPIAISPGTAGTEPDLSLDYSSQTGDGTLGWGWMLSGIPSIGRCPRTLAQDKVHGSVNFDTNDRFCMEGQRLVAISGTYGANGTIYRTEIDGFSQITSYGTAGNGPSYFVVQTKAGQTMEFGNTTSSKILAQGKTTVRVWALDKLTDSKGDYYTVTYTNDTTNGQAYPIEIDYTGNAGAGLTPYNSVVFAYNTSRLYPVPTYQAGSLSKTTVLLTDVRTYLGTGGSGTLVSDYRLAYNPPASATAHYELTSVTQCDAITGGHCLTPTIFGWQGTGGQPSMTEYVLPSGAYPNLNLNTQNQGQLVPGDFNGDGLTDVMINDPYPYPNSQNQPCDIFAGTGNPAAPFVSSGYKASFYQWTYEPPIWYAFRQATSCLNQWDIERPLLVPSRGGSGYSDLILDQEIGPHGQLTGFYLQNGSPTSKLLQSPNKYGDYAVNGIPADFDGDGKTDFFASATPTPGQYWIFYAVGGDLGPFSAGPGFVIGDFDGDGCADILDPKANSGPPTQYGPSYAANTILYSCQPAAWKYPTGIAATSEIVAGDFNGDGKTDILEIKATGGGTLYLSTGTGLVAQAGFTVPSDWNKFAIEVGDFNGDGKQDIALIADGDTQLGHYGKGTPSQIWLSTGTGFVHVASYDIPTVDAQITAVVADWNNDGASDLWIQRASGDAQYLFGFAPPCISTVTNGIGITTTVTYDRINDPSVYARGSGAVYPTQDLDGPLYVVSAVSSSNAVGGTYTSTYAYQAAQADLHGRGFLGFAQLAVTDSQTGIVQTTTYGQAFPFSGIIMSQTKVSASVTLNSTTNTYGQVSLGTGTDGVSRYFVELQKTVVVSNDLNGAALPTATTTYAYDCDTGSACAGTSPTGYGNATQIAVSVSDGSSRTTNNTYVNDTSNSHWYLARLTGATQTNVVGSSNFTRRTSFTYDTGLSTSTGLLTSEIVEPETSSDPTLKLETDYSYDTFGNKTQAAVKGCVWSGGSCSTTTRATQTTFDATTYHGQFPTTVINALSQQETWSYTGDTQFGGPTSHTGPNGLTTTWQYDTFGRKTLEIRPDGNKTAIAYALCTRMSCPTLPAGLTLAQLPANVQFYVETTPETSAGAQNGPISVTFYDGLSRAIASDVEGFDASGTGCTATAPCWIRAATQYDAYGRVGQTSRPYFVSGGTPQWTVNTYDVLGRVTLATFPDNSTLATTYCGLTISTKNADNQFRTTVENAQGKTAQVYELATANCNTSGNLTSYVYDAFDDLLTVTDAAHNTVANSTYDIRGRRTQSIDPDKGTWTYVYDGFGELATQTDARSQVTSVAYDALGRVLTHNASGFTSTYVYDTASGKGVGQLASATNGSSFSRTFAYDSLGRPSSVTLTEDGTAHAYALAYDANGRLLTLAYPSGFTAKYVYTANGYLNQVNDNVAGTVLWTAKTRDAELHLLTQTQGNGVTTTEAFNPATGLVQSILAGTANAISNQTFTFDALGNLTTRTWLNGSASVKENACYDGLNRVTSTLITTGTGCTGTGSITIAYDALGNITQKSDICSTANCFVYGGSGAGPHALTSIVGTYNGVTNPTFTYDANGLMAAGAGRTVTATTFDMAASITEGSNSAAFSYDSEHARYKMVTAGVNAGTTYYLNGPGSALEEEAVVGGTTNWRDYIMADGKLTAERFCVGAAPCAASPTLTYFVLDHLGSVAVIVSSSGSVLNQLSYDAWGKRRNPDGSAINCVAGTVPPSGVTRGFTGQEMIDGLCLVNLNARVYDPSLGRFMGADPTVGDETVPQELNRYTYVLDNPLSLTDPSGLCFLGCFWRDALFRDILGLAVAVFLVQPELVALEGGAEGLPAADLVINGGIAGGISGVISTGTLKGAALGALQGGLFAGAGNLTQGLKPTAGTFSIAYTSGELVSHGLIGGLTSELGGGRFGSGFLAGAISTFAPAPTPGQPIGETFEGTIISATLGGAGSVLGGGKFENGAVTGAFGYLFNAVAHPRAPSPLQQIINETNAWEDLQIPQVRAFLDMIEWSEGGAYNELYGGGHFSDYSTFPSPSRNPSPAGAYQINFPTFGDMSRALGLTDFSPATQDLMAVELLIRSHAMTAILAGNVGSALRAASPAWSSLPMGPSDGGTEGYYTQTQHTYIQELQHYNSYLNQLNH